LTIGALAKEAGVHVETIRYYQRRGLLDEPVRPAGGIQNRAIAGREPDYLYMKWYSNYPEARSGI